MKHREKRIILVVILCAGLVGAGALSFLFLQKKEPQPLPAVEEMESRPRREIIGTSVQGRNIESYTFGNGDTHLLFVGGVHGGYEWNTVVLADAFIEYFPKHPDAIPDNLRISIIPNANPDGAQKGMGKAEARFNARAVDVNRNFDCKWQPESRWQGNAVSAGSSPFSEPEARAIRDFVLEHKPRAVIFWHSQANAVYASECETGILPETLDIMRVYAGAAGYQAIDSFDHYEITGDAEGWLASLGIPAITVELSTHETMEWERNLSGVEALFTYYR